MFNWNKKAEKKSQKQTVASIVSQIYAYPPKELNITNVEELKKQIAKYSYLSTAQRAEIARKTDAEVAGTVEGELFNRMCHAAVVMNTEAYPVLDEEKMREANKLFWMCAMKGYVPAMIQLSVLGNMEVLEKMMGD